MTLIDFFLLFVVSAIGLTVFVGNWLTRDHRRYLVELQEQDDKLLVHALMDGFRQRENDLRQRNELARFETEIHRESEGL